MDDITAIAAGATHTCALTADGGVLCWGVNWQGQVGDGSEKISRPTPVGVSGLASGVQAITAGADHTCALTTEAGVKCWGSVSDEAGRTPMDVPSLAGGVQAIAAGSGHTCALTVEGGVKCWGNNWYGQLGNGEKGEARRTPVDVVGLASGVRAIAAGSAYTCALTTAGGVKCWGNNELGQIGDGTIGEARLTPVDVSGLGRDVQAVTLGGGHSCALTGAGGVRCWGYNEYGQLGDGQPGDGATGWIQPLPVDVSGLASGVQAVAAGWRHTCALTAGGGVKCWGDNWAGQIGDTTNGLRDRYRPLPVDVAGLANGVQAVTAGEGHTCALTTTGGVKCWGGNYHGQLGNGASREELRRLTPEPVRTLNSGVQAIAGGSGHTCALTAGGVKCWGDNQRGQAGDGAGGGNRLEPVSVSGLGNGVQAVAAGGQHTCALTTAGGVKCWGSNQYGQLGDGASGADRPAPVDVSGLSSNVQAITAGDYHTCALTTRGGVKCWGRNAAGQVGDGTNGVDRLEPVNVSGLTSGVQAIAAGGAHACALTSSGGLWCWGYNKYGQLGDGTTADRWAPVRVSSLSSGVGAIAGGYTHSCAVMKTGGVKCWGRNLFGQVGDGALGSIRLTPADVSGMSSGGQMVAASIDHTCALTASDGVKCWGSNYFGQLGDGTARESWTPVSTRNLSSIQAIAGGGYHTCALTTGGGVLCWGQNWLGQLAINPGWTPVDVIVLAPAAFLPGISAPGENNVP